jgi:hypothetical protein
MAVLNENAFFTFLIHHETTLYLFFFLPKRPMAGASATAIATQEPIPKLYISLHHSISNL